MKNSTSIKFVYRDNKLTVIPCTALNNAEARMIDWLAGKYRVHVSIIPETLNQNTINYLVQTDKAYKELLHGINSALYSAEIHNPNDYITLLKRQMRVILYHDFSSAHNDTIPDAMEVWNDAIYRMFSCDGVLDIASVSKSGKQRTYAFQAGKRACQNYIKRKQRLHTKNDEFTQDFDTMGSIDMQANISMLIDTCNLSDTDRHILKCYYAGYSQSEIAKQYDISQPAIAKRMKRCANALSDSLTAQPTASQPKAQPTASQRTITVYSAHPVDNWIACLSDDMQEYTRLKVWLANPVHMDRHVTIK